MYKILNIHNAYELKVGVFMYEFFIDLLPKPFDDFFKKRSDIHNYHTRNNSDYNQTRNKKYLLIKRFEQPDQFFGMLSMIISKI